MNVHYKRNLKLLFRIANGIWFRHSFNSELVGFFSTAKLFVFGCCGLRDTADFDRLMNLGSLRIRSNPIPKWCAERQEGTRKGSHHRLRLARCRARDGQSCVASINTICRESGQFNLVQLCHTNLILSGIHRQ
jgi:hypothetical protein